MAASSCRVVFIGTGGKGPWQRWEVESAMRRQAVDGSRIIPALLPEASEASTPYAFPGGCRPVDFRKGLNDDHALWFLECEVRGVSPGEGRPMGGSPSRGPSASAMDPASLAIPGGRHGAGISLLHRAPRGQGDDPRGVSAQGNGRVIFFQEDRDLAEAMKAIIRGEGCKDLKMVDRLEAAGLARENENGKIGVGSYFAQSLRPCSMTK
ncbi:MAG: hypothetical protein GY859_39200 [Desulfobacterales bacterium]|nr:hypothetical protein [Desulfobacterales bacterium]